MIPSFLVSFSNCKRGNHLCFLEYTSSPRWKNIAIKLFTGGPAYSMGATCRFKNECRHSLEGSIKNMELFTFIGVSELWELSILLLYRKVKVEMDEAYSDFLFSPIFNDCIHNVPDTFSYAFIR